MENRNKKIEVKKLCDLYVDDILFCGKEQHKCKVTKKIEIQTHNGNIKKCYELTFDDGKVEYWNAKGIKSFFSIAK
jgi:hypothetical protein